jgi:hypothetical protein
MTKDMVKNAFLKTVPATFLDRFPDQVLRQIMQDSPSGFVPGVLTLGTLNVDLPDFDPQIPIMDFEVSGAGDFLELDGYFIPIEPLVSIPDGTLVRIYAQDGLHATTMVDAVSGYFRTAITGIPPGGIPLLFTFSSPWYDGVSNKAVVRNLATALPSGTFLSPCFAYVKNSNTCAPALSLTLAWDGPTSDIDLHVVEPFGGKEVYYHDMIGAFGSLDVDDTDGYGPEHYSALSATSGQVFRAKVNAFSMGIDATVVWTLQARMNGKLIWTQTGTFTSSEEHSDTFDVEIGQGGRQLSSNSCGLTCPPTYGNIQWCTVWNWYGDDECDNHAQLDLYNVISSMQSPTKQDLKLIVQLLFLPAVIKVSKQNYQSLSINRYETAMDAIVNSNDLSCTTGLILEAVCDVGNKESSYRAFQFLLAAVKSLKTVAPFFAGGSGFITGRNGYMNYLKSLGKVKVEKEELLNELNGVATTVMMDDLASNLLTCI